MRAKTFVLYFFYTMVGFVLYNFIVWHLFTEQILTRKDGMVSGDLTRMGYIPHLIQPRVEHEIDLPKRHIRIEDYNYEPVDMITIGDSFSQGMGFGYNPFYQDYFASGLGLEVLNLMQHDKTRNYMETAVLLANSGFLEKSGAKYLLIESAVRKIVDRHTGNVNYDLSFPLDELDAYYGIGQKREIPDLDALPSVSFINNGNFKYLAFKVLYHFSDRAFISRTHKVELSEDLFTVGNGRELLFLHKSVRSMQRHHTPDNLKAVNDNLNQLAEFLEKEHGVKLVFMPAPTKYDLYSSFIVDNPYGTDPFFDIMRSFKDKKYLFVDTKAILLKELEKGEKDVYFCDDTHWTHKAPAAITKALKPLLGR